MQATRSRSSVRADRVVSVWRGPEGWEGRGSMTLEGILLGLVALAIGAAFSFYGFRFFLILLPLWAFLVGFSAGAQLMSVLVR